MQQALLDLGPASAAAAAASASTLGSLGTLYGLGGGGGLGGGLGGGGGGGGGLQAASLAASASAAAVKGLIAQCGRSMDVLTAILQSCTQRTGGGGAGGGGGGGVDAGKVSAPSSLCLPEGEERQLLDLTRVVWSVLQVREGDAHAAPPCFA